MKRTICLVLTAALLCAAIVSCAAPNKSALGAKIRLTSSDAADAAAWLTARLGDKLTDRVVLGTDADGYGVDVSALEDDGYFIRSFGREDVLFAKTANGLDRAARKYAKMVEAGAVSDVTYHEGARIKKLTIAGRDIAEYTIYCEDEARMIDSANDFAELICRACGVKPAVSCDAPAAPYIALRYAADESLGYSGYRWSVDEDGLTVECSDAYKKSSARYAVRRFLQGALDWYGVSSGFEYLPEADLIELAAGESGGETPDFEWELIYGGSNCKYDHYDNECHDIGPDRHSCHGIQAYKIAGELSNSPDNDWSKDLPCWLDEDFYELSVRDVKAIIQRRLDAGQVIGEDLVFVDIAAGDNAFWCECKECTALKNKEGAQSAVVLTWANSLIDEVNETYPGLNYGIFAYAGTNRPPKTVTPHEQIVVTFCFDRNCSAHPLDGSRCTWGDPSPGRKYGPRDNLTYAGYLEKWVEISEKVYVWYYGLTASLLTMSFVHNVRNDWRYMHDKGVRGVIWDTGDTGYDTNWITHQLATELVWNVDMTDEEYAALYGRVLCATYGEDAAPLIGEYINVIDRVYESSRCQSCWQFGKYVLGMIDFLYALSADPGGMAKQYDLLFALVEEAIKGASNARQERRLVCLGASTVYKGSVAAYPYAQAAGDAERMAELSRRYRLMVDRLAAYGAVAEDGFYAGDNWLTDCKYPLTIEELYPEGGHRERYIDPKPFD